MDRDERWQRRFYHLVEDQKYELITSPGPEIIFGWGLKFIPKNLF